MRGDFRVDFVLLFGIKGEVGETLADEFLPIRHQALPLTDRRFVRR